MLSIAFGTHLSRCLIAGMGKKSDVCPKTPGLPKEHEEKGLLGLGR